MGFDFKEFGITVDPRRSYDKEDEFIKARIAVKALEPFGFRKPLEERLEKLMNSQRSNNPKDRGFTL